MFKRTYISAIVAAVLVVACPTAAMAAPASATAASSLQLAAGSAAPQTPTKGTPSAGKGADPYAADLASDTAAGSDASITIGDNGNVVSSKGLTAAQISQVEGAFAASGSSRTATATSLAGTGSAAVAAPALVGGATMHHTWHWWGLHVWVNFTVSKTNYIYYHSWTIAAVVASICGGIAVIDGWAGAACLVSAGVQTGRILDGVSYAHDHGKGLRLDFNINWSGATWITTGTA